MKRILVALFLILSFVICLPSCNDSKVEENPEFARFNEMFNAKFENYTITVSATAINSHLTATETYVVNTVNGERTVAYRIESLNLFEINGDSITVPENFITVTEGVYVGEDAMNSKYDVPEFKFSNTCLTPDIIKSDVLCAYITSLSTFMGLDVPATDAAVIVSVENNAATSIQISYIDSANNYIDITYSFK